MSTKTTFKRIALVAVASLGFGMLSVAPSNAAVFAYTTSLGTITPADGSAVAGSTITIPLVLDTAAVNTVTSVAVFTASFVAVPNNSARVSANLLAGSVTRTGATAATNLTNAASATTTQAVPTANTIVVSSGATNAPQLVAAPAGEFSFTADVPGVYQVSIIGAVAAVDVGTPTFTNTATTAITIIVGGAALTQATGGLGTATGTATTAGSAVVSYTMPGATAAAARFNVTSTGVGSISNPQDCALDSVVLSNASGAVRCTTGGSTTEGFANGVNTADGLFFNNTTLSAGNVLIGPSAQTVFTVDAASAVAGVQTITVTSIALATGAPTTRATITITWGANPTASTSLTQVWAGQSSTRPVALETTALRLPSTAGVAASSTDTSVVAIAVNVNSGEGTALNGVPVSATISGPGLLSITSGAGNAAAGTARSVALTGTAQAATHQSIIGVSGDGTRGVATITISSGTTVLATKTVTFYGAVATLTATQGVGVMRSGRTATSDTATDFTLGGATASQPAATAITMTTATNISIVAKDVDGNVVPLAAVPTFDISDSAVIGAVNIVSCAGQAVTTVCAAGAGNWIANTVSAIGGVSGAKATVTFKTPHPTLPATFISTAAVPFSLGGSAAGGVVTMTLDKTTYLPGERMIITYTAKDAAGNPVRDWASTGTPASNKAIQGLSGGIYVNGSHIYGDGTTELTYAPTAPGAFTVTLGTGTATGATITATATVADDAATAAANAAGDAAAEATDAANAATDAANAAAEAADAATAAAQDAADAVAALSASVSAMVSDLKKQITSLTNLVIKIQKKVRA